MSNAEQDLEEARRASEEQERLIDSAILAADLRLVPGLGSATGDWDIRVMVADGAVLWPVTDWRGQVHRGRKTLTLFLGETGLGQTRWEAAETAVRRLTRTLQYRPPVDAPDTFRSALAGLGRELERWQAESGDAAALDAIMSAMDNWSGYDSDFQNVLRKIAGILERNGRLATTWTWEE